MNSARKDVSKRLAAGTLSASSFIVSVGLVASSRKKLDTFIKKQKMQEYRSPPNDFLFRNDLKDSKKKLYQHHWKELRSFFFWLGIINQCFCVTARNTLKSNSICYYCTCTIPWFLLWENWYYIIGSPDITCKILH